MFDPKIRWSSRTHRLGKYVLDATISSPITPLRRAVEQVLADASAADHRELGTAPGCLLYLLLDTLTADYMPTIDALDDTLDGQRTAVFHTSNTANPQHAFSQSNARSCISGVSLARSVKCSTSLARGDALVIVVRRSRVSSGRVRSPGTVGGSERNAPGSDQWCTRCVSLRHLESDQ